MKGIRTIGLLLAGVLLLFATWWFTKPQSETATKPSTGSTNSVAASRPRPSATNSLAARRTGGDAKAATNTAFVSTARGTNTLASKPIQPAGSPKPGSLVDRIQALRQHRLFYPALAAVPLALGLLFLFLARKSNGKAKDQVTPSSVAAAKGPRKGNTTAIHSCNVLQVGPETRNLWQFGVRSASVQLVREHTVNAGQSLPAKAIGKDWANLWQRKLNIAWVPPEHVFLRAIQLPKISPAETAAMVELQLEKLSPMPVTQVVWSLQILPEGDIGMQTVVVMVIARSIVEEFLGKLETEGFLADRIEFPVLDQLRATMNGGRSNGAWVFPAPSTPTRNIALVAWRYGGVLRNLGLISMPKAARPEGLREQLTQIAWAGELEGWLTSSPSWHLIADDTLSAEWGPALTEGLQQQVEILPPPTPQKLAGLTVARVAHDESQGNLLPQEHANRYRQTFVDRLWMRALAAIVLLYVSIAAVYLVALKVADYRVKAVEREVRNWSPYYTNALQLKAQYQVLKDRQELKYAALDCWKAVAELLPENVVLEGFNFSEGRRLNLSGTATPDLKQEVNNFEGSMRKVSVNGQQSFAPNRGETVSYQPAPGGNISWNFSLELKRSEMQ